MLLHQLALRGALSVKTADACAEFIPGLTPDPYRCVLLSVDLGRERREILNDLVWFADWFRDRWKKGRPREKGGRPSTVRSDTIELMRRRFLEATQGVERAWPGIKAARSAQRVRDTLKKILWPRPTEQQTGFKAAGLTRIFRPFYLEPSERQLSVVGAVAADVVNGKIRKPKTCVESIWAGLHGTDRRTIRNHYWKKTPRKKH
jgi:hypothetical protein